MAFNQLIVLRFQCFWFQSSTCTVPYTAVTKKPLAGAHVKLIAGGVEGTDVIVAVDASAEGVFDLGKHRYASYGRDNLAKCCEHRLLMTCEKKYNTGC